jgi:hypothetical protein
VSPVKYELGFYIPKDVILHSEHRENPKSYIAPVKYELGYYISEDAILHSHRRENLKPYMFKSVYIVDLEINDSKS